MSIRPQRGFTLIELMIAIAISLILLLAISQVYLASNDTQRAQTDASRLNETGRFALALISTEVRKAGLRNIWQAGSSANKFCATTPARGGSAFVGCNDQGDPLGSTPYSALDPAAATTLGATPPTMTCGGTGDGNGKVSNGSDVLRVRYRGDDSTTGAAVLDCLGNTVARDLLVEDTLYVASDATTGEPALYCRTTNGNTALPLVVGVESMQLLYGEDTDTDGTANRYVPWHLISNPDNVVSVVASFVVRSPNAVANADSSATPFDLFGSTYAGVRTSNLDSGARFTPSSTLYPAASGAPATNLRLRAMLSTEIAIKNYRDCN